MAKTQENAAAVAETETQEVVFAGAIQPLLDADKVKAIKEALGGDRVYFESSEEKGTAFDQAAALIESAAGKTSNFHGIPFYASEKAQDTDRLMVATLGVRDKGDSSKGIKARNGYKAIVVFPIPSVADFLASTEEKAVEFVSKLIEREAADVAFSGLRQAETYEQLTTALGGLPVTVSEIVDTARESGGVSTEAFDAMWSPFRTGYLKEKVPALYALLPQKPDVVKAIRSKSFALANPKTQAIEERGFFVKIAQAMIQLAPNFKDDKGNPVELDVSPIQEWLDTRDTNTSIVYKVDVPVDASALDKIDF